MCIRDRLHLYQLYLYKVFPRHLNMECFELAVLAIFLSYAPTFFDYKRYRTFFFEERHLPPGLILVRSTCSMVYYVCLAMFSRYSIEQQSILIKTAFAVFIRRSQNIRRHNALVEYKPYTGGRRKHWIETSILKLIFNPFSYK